MRLNLLLLAAFGAVITSTLPAKEVALIPLTEIKAKLVFACAHERIPAPSGRQMSYFNMPAGYRKTTC